MNTRNARQLRSRMTDVEELLWLHVRAHRLGGFKFKRQQPMGPYIADFICFSARLVIELDGGHHAEQAALDAERDRWFTSRGYRVMRFWNAEVMENLPIVLCLILAALTSPLEGEVDTSEASAGEGAFRSTAAAPSPLARFARVALPRKGGGHEERRT